MFNLLSMISILFTEHSSSFLSAAMVSSVLKNALAKVIDFILDIVWVVCKFVLGVMDAFQYMIEYFLGIGSTAADIVEVADSVRVTSFGNKKYLEIFVNAFKAIAGVSLLLLIVFTIVAIVKQEYQFASSGFEGDAKKGKGNSKSGIVMRMFRGMMSIILLPITLFIVISGLNAILTSFQAALSNGMSTTVAGQVLATSTYDANKYRTYANANQRVPILIQAYNSVDIKQDELADMAYKIKSLTVQQQLRTAASNLANGTFPAFGETVKYKNNKIYNSGEYPDIYEKFVCTNEQYQIMADFVDYAQLNQINYYIKSMDDPMVEWKYVDEVVYSREKNTLNITYRDATDMNGDGNEDDTYVVSFTPTNEITTPISDALDSIMAMLGVGEYSDNQYKVMERDDSGDFLNLVQWANEKALIKLSSGFIKNDPSTWTDTDEIIFYEYNHFSSNNTFERYTLEDFIDGVELDVYEIAYRDYNATLGAYTDRVYIYCVLINGTYYRVVQSDSLTNNYGNPYYLLESKNITPGDTYIRYLEPSYFSLEKLDPAEHFVNLKTSNLFDINDPDTWSYLDQVLIYEYYKDLTYNNDLSNFIFEDFDYDGAGVNFGVYKMIKYIKTVNPDTNIITGGTTETYYYTLINDNYYALTADESAKTYSFPALKSGNKFLNDPEAQNQTCYNYDVQLDLTVNNINGFYDSLTVADRKKVSEFYTKVDAAALSGYSEVDFSTAGISARVLSYVDFQLGLSEGFKHTDVSTWTYKDYFVFYLYVNLGIGTSIDNLRFIGVEGTVVKQNAHTLTSVDSYTKLLYLVQSNTTGDYYALNIAAVQDISEQKILDHIDVQKTISNNSLVDTEQNNIFVTFEEGTTKLQVSEIDSKHFELSSEFDEYIVSTWTVGDLILYYFSSKDLLYPLSTLKDAGYTAMVYKIPDSNAYDGVDDSDTLYRFGKAYDATNSPNTVYLSEKRVLASISGEGAYEANLTLDSWLELDVSALIMNLYGISSESLFTAEKDLAGNVLGNYSSQILSVNSLYSAIIGDNWNLNLDAIAKYTYANPTFKQDDLATWTHFDLLLFALNGSASGTYTAPVVVNEGVNYLIFGDKAVNVSGESSLKMIMEFNPFVAGDDPTDLMVDETVKGQSFATSAFLVDYFNDNYLAHIKEYSTSIRVSTSIKLKYESDIAADLKLADISNTTNLSAMDIILLALEGEIKHDKVYSFNIYSDGMNEYIMIGNKYVQIYKKTIGIDDLPIYYYFDARMKLADSTAKPFSNSISPATYAYNGNLSGGVSYLDAVIYEYTKSFDPATYKVYNGLSTQYIVVQSSTGDYRYIEYKDFSKTTLTYGVNTVSSGSNELAMHLYNKYYSHLYSNGISSATATPEEGDPREICYELNAGKKFEINEISTWTPFRLILWANGIIPSNCDEDLVIDSLKTTTDGKVYFCGEKNDSGKVEKYYINITDLCEKTEHIGNTIYYFVDEKETSYTRIQFQMAMELNFATNTLFATDVHGKPAGKEQLLSGFNSATPKAITSYTGQIIDDYQSTGNINFVVDRSSTPPVPFNKNTPSTWTWYDLIYYNIKSKYPTEDPDEKIYMYLSGNQQFVNIKNGSEDNFVVYDDGIYKLANFFVESDHTLTSGSALETIVKEITGSTPSTIKKYTFTSSNASNKKHFYWIKKTVSGSSAYFAVYNLIETPGAVLTVNRLETDNATTSPQYTNDKADTAYLRISYTPTNETAIKDWTVFDYLFYMANSAATSMYYESYLYMYSGKQYFLVGGNYLNLSECLSFVDIDIANRVLEAKNIKLFGDNSNSLINVDKDTNSSLQGYTTLSAGYKGVIDLVDADEITDANAGSLTAEILRFSSGFKFSDYSTWKMSDFMIYYAFMTGHYEGVLSSISPQNEFAIAAKKTEVVNGVEMVTNKMYYYSLTNFQTFVNSGGAVGYINYLVKTDEYGSVFTYKVINFNNKWKSPKNLYFDYDVFTSMYGRKLVQVETIEDETPEISMAISNIPAFVYNAGNPTNPFTYTVAPEAPKGDFIYNNYYFFNIDSSVEKEFGLSYSNLDDAIAEKSVKKYGYLNFKLSQDFDIDNLSTWTILDYIIVKEFSRSAGTTNVYDMFSNMDFEDLKEDNYINVYSRVPVEETDPPTPEPENVAVISINGHEYNLQKFIKTLGDDSSTSKEYFVTEETLEDADANEIPDVIDDGGYPAGVYKYTYTPTGGSEKTIAVGSNSSTMPSGVDSCIVIPGTVNNYTIRTKYSEIPFSVNSLALSTPTVNGTAHSAGISAFIQLESNAETISYVFDTAPEVRYFRSIYKNTREIYQVDLDTLSTYEISPLVKQVGWPQKLMNDMQVLYPDLNWNTLIATDGWLDTLGEFTSAYTNGMFVTKGNSSNTTAAGLVLSEFFVSVAKTSGAGYASYEYESLFDEDVIKSLMLALLGEEDYVNLSQQAEIFMEMFNKCFAAVLEDIATKQGVQIVNGQVDNFVMCVYKSYLATVLLSSDFGEYLYTIATRIYAEYTIYESLATASGDYGTYYAYLNEFAGDDGETVDAFKYSSFKELVLYENKYIGVNVPVYTFNMLNVYTKMKEDAGSTQTKSEIASEFRTRKRSDVDSLYYELYVYLQDLYKSVYNNSRSTISDSESYYCFMFDAYWSAMQTLQRKGQAAPDYIKNYKRYLDGNIARWEIIDDISILGASSYVNKYEKYVKALDQSKTSFIIDIYKTYIKLIKRDYNEDMNILDMIAEFCSGLIDGTPFTLVSRSFSSTMNDELLSIVKDSLFVYNTLTSSESGNEAAWEKIKEFRTTMNAIVEELREVIELPYSPTGSNRTAKGSQKLALYSENDYLYALDIFSEFYSHLDSYVNAQEIIDMVDKASITYHLKQFGQNYVTTGYKFNIENNDYTFNTSLSAGRLAEYVYGGKYLTQYGINATYTSNDYEGIVSQTKVYDSVANMMKTELGMWTELRSFASELADYTAELYFLTNLSDLSGNVVDKVNLDEYIYANVRSNGAESIKKTTLEYLILRYIIEESYLAPELKVALIFGDSGRYDSVDAINAMIPAVGDPTINFDNIRALSASVYNNTVSSMSENDVNEALFDYLAFVQQDYYDSGYWNNDGNYDLSERLHMMFKSIMEYLLVSKDQAEEMEKDEELLAKKVKLDDITFKDLKVAIMEKIVGYDENEEGKENSNRYLTLFNLINSQFDYYSYQIGTMPTRASYLGTILLPAEIDRLGGTEALKYKTNNTWLYLDFGIDNSTQDTVLRLAGLANRPIEELVGLEYEELYNRNGNYDEALGDIFIVCTYDPIECKYVPVMASGKKNNIADYSNSSNYKKYYNDYGLHFRTSYYDNEEGAPKSYPIIAKGIISAAGLPTAIKIEDGNVKFYRTNITAATVVNESAVAATAGVSEVNSVGYTDYVETSSYREAKGANKATMFISSLDIKSYLSSDIEIFFMQEALVYSLVWDEFGGGSVFDNYSAYYVMGGQSYFLLVLGITTMLPILFNATASVLRRVLDLMFLTLAGPVFISMRSLSSQDDDKNGFGEKAFKSWRDMVEKSLLAAMGYIVAFNVYYILVTTVMSMTFISPNTVQNVLNIGGLSFVSINLLESIFKYMWLVAAAALIKSAGTMLTTIITAGKVINPFAPSIGSGKGQDKEVMESVKDYGKQAIKMAKLAGDVVSGQAFIEMKDAVLQKAMDMVPGSELMQGAGKIKNAIGGKMLEQKAISKGVDPATAKASSKELTKQANSISDAKRNVRKQNAENFANKWGGG